jgi:large subunit ribosomal protein L29
VIFKELKDKSSEELQKMDGELRGELFMLKLKNKTGQLDKSHKLKALRKDIARIQTRLGELAKTAAQ